MVKDVCDVLGIAKTGRAPGKGVALNDTLGHHALGINDALYIYACLRFDGGEQSLVFLFVQTKKDEVTFVADFVLDRQPVLLALREQSHWRDENGPSWRARASTARR